MALARCRAVDAKSHQQSLRANTTSMMATVALIAAMMLIVLPYYAAAEQVRNGFLFTEPIIVTPRVASMLSSL